MKTLEEIKDDLSKEYGHNLWSGFKVFCFKDDIQGSSDMLAMMNVVCERYALQEVKKHLEIASNEASKPYLDSGFTNLADRAIKSITGIKIELT